MATSQVGIEELFAFLKIPYYDRLTLQQKTSNMTCTSLTDAASSTEDAYLWSLLFAYLSMIDPMGMEIYDAGTSTVWEGLTGQNLLVYVTVTNPGNVDNWWGLNNVGKYGYAAGSPDGVSFFSPPQWINFPVSIVKMQNPFCSYVQTYFADGVIATVKTVGLIKRPQLQNNGTSTPPWPGTFPPN